MKIFYLCFLLISLTFSAEVIYKNKVIQGEPINILIRSQNKLSSSYLIYKNQKINFRNIYFSPDKNIYRVILGTDPTNLEGQITIPIYVNNKKLRNIAIHIQKKDFPTDFIELPSAKKEILTVSNLQTESSILGKAFKTLSPQALWNDKFIMPAEGRISSPYGQQRRYNTKALAWWHRGVDIANMIGTKIQAPNDGIVILVDNFKIHGNTIMLDHGHGIISIFNHLENLKVKRGQLVKKGDIIATMGNTGSSTGPHLHWGLSVNDVRVDPLFWVENKFAPNYF